MGKEYTVQEALRLAIKAEKDSMDFYQKAASVTGIERAKKVFRLLADEEKSHTRSSLPSRLTSAIAPTQLLL